MNFREAVIDDAMYITKLHALSWQQNFKSILSDDFLNRLLLSNRFELR